ncbi:DUF167 family protein [Thiohalobacter sp. IOR34]|uniref:DUF167 family protein n=1 Tax=Thiohalobacter sp. IOR34 TaxID=3057176 RepID=UPI00339D572B
MPGWYRWDGEDLILSVHVQPRARQDGFAGVHGERLKIRITAPPADGKANRHLIRFLADACGVAPSRVELLSGHGSRSKQLRIHAPRRLPPGC